MSREVIITIPGQGVEPKTPEALLIESVRNYQLLKELNPRLIAKFISPNSYGLYAGLVIAGVITLAVGIKLARSRANLVIEAEERREEEGLGRTGMLAILGKDVEYVKALAQKHGLDITNYNGPLAHVVGGLKDRLEEVRKEVGRTMVLATEGVYHHKLRAPESLTYRPIVKGQPMLDPGIPLIFSTQPRIGNTASEGERELYEQMHHAVNLPGMVNIWKQTGIETAIDIGDSDTMKKLTSRMSEGQFKVLALADPKDRELIVNL